MLNELLNLVKKNRRAIALVIIIFAVTGMAVISAYLIVTYGTAPAAPSPTPRPTTVPTPTVAATPEPSPTATPEPSPTPTPVPTVTPDLDIKESITPLDQYAPNYMVHVDQSMTAGQLSLDLAHSDSGGQYAYLNDTYVTHFTLVDISNAPVGRIKIHTICRNDSGTDYTVYESERVDTVLLNPSDKISRTVGFQVGAGTPPGKYIIQIEVYTDPDGNESWSGYGCGFETGLNILRP